MSKFIDHTGQVFGRLTVLARAPSKGWVSMWLCRCECGAEKTVIGSLLRKGKVKSCGCLRSDLRAAANRTHGLCGKVREYGIWNGMRWRCRDSSFGRYGGRGITVCERWLGRYGFENFLADMGPCPTSSHEIDRINNDGNYEPKNCRWATRKQQMRNMSRNRLVTYMGETKAMSEWCEKLHLHHGARIRRRLAGGMPPERAFTRGRLPHGKRRRKAAAT